MNSIWVFPVLDFAELLACIKNLPSFLKEHRNVRLVVVDSIAFHFRAEFDDMGARSRMLNVPNTSFFRARLP